MPEFPPDPFEILAEFHTALDHHKAIQAVNARTMRKTSGPVDPRSRELTFEEVCCGTFGDDTEPWRWPAPVFVALDDAGEFVDDLVAGYAAMLRGFANLYEAGYRLVGPPPSP